MIPRARYDFNDMEMACNLIIESDGKKGLMDLKKEINRFFSDSKCLDILYTHSDQLFFGMCVMPVCNKELVTAIMQDDKTAKIKEYFIEIDSRLLDPLLGITPQEMVAMLLHEIGHLVNDTTPIEQVKKALALQLVKSNDTMNIPKSEQYYTIISYGIKDTIRKVSSMFFIYKDGEVLADEFVHMYGYGDELNSIFNKICKSGKKINDPTTNKLTALAWSLSVYKNIKMKRIPALKLLEKMKYVTGSKLEKKDIESMENAIKTVNPDTIYEYTDYMNKANYSILNESGKSIRTKYAELRRKATLNDIRKFEQDLYEYKMRIKHVVSEDDAFYLMRMVNLRISVLEDFLGNEKLDEAQQKRWWTLLGNYYSLRDELANNVTYRTDYSDSIIQVSYPEIKPGRI